MAIFHNNANWSHGLNGIVEQTRIVEYSARHLAANKVIVERRWKYFNLVVHMLHAFQMFHCTLSSILDKAIADLAIKRHGSAVNAISQVVENSHLRDHCQLMTNLASQPLLKLGIARLVGRIRKRQAC